MGKELLKASEWQLRNTATGTKKETVFGGKRMIIFGDLFQLPAISKRRNDNDSQLYQSDLWNKFELTELCRQRDDPEYGQLLNRVRIGEQAAEDLVTLQRRELWIRSSENRSLLL